VYSSYTGFVKIKQRKKVKRKKTKKREEVITKRERKRRRRRLSLPLHTLDGLAPEKWLRKLEYIRKLPFPRLPVPALRDPQAHAVNPLREVLLGVVFEVERIVLSDPLGLFP